MSGWQFPQWNYGYTQMPAYNYYQGQPPYSAPQHRPPPPPPPSNKPRAEQAVIKKEAVINPAVAKKEAVTATVAEAGSTGQSKEEGEIVEKSIIGILRGRNPVMFCNDQSKLRGLHMEWEQISEIGPPHDKTFEYQLKMGDMAARGMGKNKKDAKLKAAESMVIKLDELPKINMKRQFGGGGWGPGGRGRGGYGGGPPWKRRKGESEEQILKTNDVTPKVDNPSQNNPISKLYEFCKKKKWPEPIFDCISEEVLEERRSEKGFTMRKTNFTMRCTVRQPPGQGEEQVFHGNALTKKQAKTNAASVAWAEIGSGVTQASVDNLLSNQRTEAAIAEPAPSAPAPKIPTQPKVVMLKQTDKVAQ